MSSFWRVDGFWDVFWKMHPLDLVIVPAFKGETLGGILIISDLYYGTMRKEMAYK